MALPSCTNRIPLRPIICGFPPINAINDDLSGVEETYLKEILALPLDSILDDGIGQRKCWKIGQKIFDKFKVDAGGCTNHGKAGAMKICNAIARNDLGRDRIRKQFVVYAWEGIGDSRWGWHFNPVTWIRDPDFRSDY